MTAVAQTASAWDSNRRLCLVHRLQDYAGTYRNIDLNGPHAAAALSRWCRMPPTLRGVESAADQTPREDTWHALPGGMMPEERAQSNRCAAGARRSNLGPTRPRRQPAPDAWGLFR